MPERGADGVTDLREVVEAHLRERIAKEEKGIPAWNPGAVRFRFFVDGKGAEWPIGPPAIVFYADGTQAVPAHEFPVAGAARKVITAPGDGNGDELLTCGVPAVELVGAYVGSHAGLIASRDDAGFVLFFDERLGYWRLAGAGIVDARYDTEAEGYWGYDRWRYWTASVRPDELCRRVALDEYLTARLPGHLRPHAATWVAREKPPLDALARPGDEWWDWVSGTEPLMQSGGLALVRCGRIVWARQDWIS